MQSTKTVSILSSILLLSCLSQAALANEAPACPSLANYKIHEVYNTFGPWEALVNNGGPIFDSGTIETKAAKKSDATATVKNALTWSKPSGHAKKVSWHDGRWFWCCDSSFDNNYTLPTGTTRIFLASPEYSPGNKLSSIQHSIRDKYIRVMQ